MPTKKNRGNGQSHPDGHVPSLSEAMGQRGPKGFGNRPVIEPVQDNIRGGSNRKGVSGKLAAGEADGPCRVSFGGGRK